MTLDGCHRQCRGICKPWWQEFQQQHAHRAHEHRECQIDHDRVAPAVCERAAPSATGEEHAERDDREDAGIGKRQVGQALVARPASTASQFNQPQNTRAGTSTSVG